MKFIIVLVSLLILSCSNNLTLNISNDQSIEYKKYTITKETNSRLINPDTSEFKIIKEFIEKNQNEWVKTPITFVPNIVINTKEFSLNIIKNNVVLSIKTEQYIKKLSEEEYKFFENL